MNVREAQKLPNKDSGPIDASCFQIVVRNEIITLRVNSASEKRRWMADIGDAIKKHNLHSSNSNIAPQSTKKAIGTLKLSLYHAKNFSKNLTGELYCIFELEDQVIKSQKRDVSKPFNQAVMFSVTSLDLNLKVTLCKYSEYSRDSNF